MRLKDVPKSEFIGLEAEVVEAANKDLIGLKGTIVDETKNTLVIERQHRVKKLLKNQVTLKLRMDGKAIWIDGKMLIGRPEERMKK